MVTVCDRSSAKRLQWRIGCALTVLNKYRWLVDAFVLDFYAEDHWARLPSGWQEVLDAMRPEDLRAWLDPAHSLKCRHVVPLSLLSLRTLSRSLSLPRAALLGPAPVRSFLKNSIAGGTRGSAGKNATLTNKCGNCIRQQEAESWDTSSVKSQSWTVGGMTSDLSVQERDVMWKDFTGGRTTVYRQEGCHTETSGKKSSSEQDLGHSEGCNTGQRSVGSAGWGSAEDDLSLTAGYHKHLAHVFRKHVKPKKQYEIVRLAQVLSMTAAAVCCSQVVDVGSGVGHLSRLLCYGHKMKVLCLEADNHYTESARKFDNELELVMKKQTHGGCVDGTRQQQMREGVNITCQKQRYESCSGVPCQHCGQEGCSDVTCQQHSQEGCSSVKPPLPPQHVTFTLSRNLDLDEFKKVVTECLNVESPHSLRFGLSGLHTCGDLSPSLLQLFVSCREAVMLHSVGCCYMKLTAQSPSAGHNGYPLSLFTQEHPYHFLSYEAREVACHALETYSKRLQEKKVEKLKIHSYRAAVETVIVKHWPHLRHSGLRSVKNAHLMEFPVYAKTAVSRLGVVLPDDDLVSPQIRSFLREWVRVVAFYCLRLMVAPLVETVILLDRLLYLYENGINSCLVPLFDPELSPRNHVLIAVKNTSSL